MVQEAESITNGMKLGSQPTTMVMTVLSSTGAVTDGP